MIEHLKRKGDTRVVIAGEKNKTKKALNVPVECHH